MVENLSLLEVSEDCLVLLGEMTIFYAVRVETMVAESALKMVFQMNGRCGVYFR